MRLQLALDVSDIDDAVDFYTRLFGAEPAKRQPGYANFAIENPPLKLVLFENPDNAGGLNHLGVETETSAQVEAAEARMDDAGLDTTGVNDTVCCYAGKTETWWSAPMPSGGSGTSRPPTSPCSAPTPVRPSRASRWNQATTSVPAAPEYCG